MMILSKTVCSTPALSSDVVRTSKGGSALMAGSTIKSDAFQAERFCVPTDFSQGASAEFNARRFDTENRITGLVGKEKGCKRHVGSTFGGLI